MKKKHLVIGAVGAAALLVAGWAFAQSSGQAWRFGPPFMHGRGPGGMGPGGMMGSMAMGPGMGPPMMGPGMQGQLGRAGCMVDRYLLSIRRGLTPQGRARHQAGAGGSLDQVHQGHPGRGNGDEGGP